jgi:hypothetical protein
MSKSPLSGAFSASTEPANKKKKKNGAILLISGIALASSIGGVFAANSITINSGDDIEFGQGVVAATSCVTALDFTVTQLFVPESSVGAGDEYFKIDQLTVVGDFSACAVGTDLILTTREANGDVVGLASTVTVIADGGTPAADEVEAAAAQTITLALGDQNLDAGLLKVVTATTE